MDGRIDHDRAVTCPNYIPRCVYSHLFRDKQRRWGVHILTELESHPGNLEHYFALSHYRTGDDCCAISVFMFNDSHRAAEQGSQ